jgi:hypothetical protein
MSVVASADSNTDVQAIGLPSKHQRSSRKGKETHMPLEQFHLCEVCHRGYTSSAMVAVHGIAYIKYQRVFPWHICKECAEKISGALKQTKIHNDNSDQQQELVEQLAAKEHSSWARWQDYFFSKCHMYVAGEHLNYSHAKAYFSLPRDLVERWKRQINTPYAELLEAEKQSDRDEVSHILPLIEAYVNSRIDNETTKEQE